MDLELLRARRIASALAGKPAPRPISRSDAVSGSAGAGCQALACRVLLEIPGVAAVDEVRVKKRWGRMRGVTACIRMHDGFDAGDVCCCAAEALAKQLRVTDACFVTALASGEAPA